MITCESLDLISYLEGEDPGGEAKKHVKACQRCRERLRIYQKLLEGLVASRRSQGTDCLKKKETVDAAISNGGANEAHLATCEVCANLYAGVKDILAELEEIVEQSTDKLPADISQQVAARKHKWLEGRLNKVFDLQGVRDEKEREARIRKILEKEAESLPKAVFPEDLPGEKDDDSEEP